MLLNPRYTSYSIVKFGQGVTQLNYSIFFDKVIYKVS